MSIPKIENAYENIVAACELRLKQLYPKGIPDSVSSRYQNELNMLSKSEYIDDFEIFRQLSEDGKKTSQYISFVGCISGSFLIYLLGYSRLNPLEPHYYCNTCGYMEVVDTHLFGLDLPARKCPSCGESLAGDGFHLTLESVWGNDGKKPLDFDYGISSEFLPFAKRVIQNIYPNNEIVSYGIFGSNQKDYVFDPKNLEVKNGGYVILPNGRTIADYPEITSYLEDGEPCITGMLNVLKSYGLKRVRLLPNGTIEHLMQLQKKSGIYAQEISLEKIGELTYYDLVNSKTMQYEEEFIFSQQMPRNFYEMVGYSAMTYNSFAAIPYPCENWYYETKEKILDTKDFQMYPCYTREDFFDYLIKCGCTRQEAFHFSELIRKGRSSKDPTFDSLSIPEELKNVAKMHLYVFPRAHCLEQMLLKARMAYYMKLDSRMYSSVINKKRNNQIQYLR